MIVMLSTKFKTWKIQIYLTSWLYFFKASLAFGIKIFVSVSSLNDITNALGTQRLTKGANIFGTNCKCMEGGPVEGILCTA